MFLTKSLAKRYVTAAALLSCPLLVAETMTLSNIMGRLADVHISYRKASCNKDSYPPLQNLPE